MLLTINILVTVILIPWILWFMLTASMLSVPTTADEFSRVILTSLIIFYPVYIFALYWIFGGTYFGISGKSIFIVSFTMVVVLHGMLYGAAFINTLYGINNSGVTITNSAVYFNGQKHPHADPQTFEPVPTTQGVSNPENQEVSTEYDTTTYYRDDTHVYWNRSIVVGADPATFHPVSVATNPARQSGANTQASFRLAGELFADDKQLYLYGAALPESSGGPVEAIGSYHFIHNNNVYYDTKVIPGADPQTFEAINDHIGKDKDRLYYEDKPMSITPDLQSFQLNGDGSTKGSIKFAKDANHVYFLDLLEGVIGIVDNADINTFEPLSYGYAKDANRVYYQRSPKPPIVVESADVKTFQVATDEELQRGSKYDAYDDTFFYQDGAIIQSETPSKWPSIVTPDNTVSK